MLWSLILLVRQINAQIEEDKDLSVLATVELKKLFPGRKVSDRFHESIQFFISFLSLFSNSSSFLEK